MTDAAYSNAMERLKKLSQEAQNLELNLKLVQSEMRSVEQFIYSWKVFSGLIERASDEPVLVNNSLTPKSSRKVKNTSKEEVAEGARRIIEERGAPVSRADLYDLLTKQGFVINGNDPQMVLSTMLWRMKDRVIRLPSGGYWLPEKPHPDLLRDAEIDEIC